MKKQNGKSYYYTDSKTTDAGEPVTFLHDLCFNLGHHLGNGVRALLHNGVSSYVYIINIFIDYLLYGVTSLPNVDGVTLNQGVHAPCGYVDGVMMHDVSFYVASFTRNAHKQEHDRPQVREMRSNARFFFLCTFCFHAKRALYAIFEENNYSDLIRDLTKMVSVGVLCNSTIGSDVGLV